MGGRIDLAGQQFGRLMVVAFAGTVGKGNAVWECRCSCGSRVVVRSVLLRKGETTSCGCLQREAASEKARRHGHATGRVSPTYVSWAGMIQRCTNPNHPEFADYGGRGITVCNRWLQFNGFLEDMGERPDGTTIDRVDNDKGYAPGNCRWATPVEQARNRRRRGSGARHLMAVMGIEIKEVK